MRKLGRCVLIEGCRDATAVTFFNPLLALYSASLPLHPACEYTRGPAGTLRHAVYRRAWTGRCAELRGQCARGATRTAITWSPLCMARYWADIGLWLPFYEMSC